MSKFYDTISLELHRYAPELNKVCAGATVLLKPYDPLLNPKGLKFDELHLWSNYRPLKQTKQYLRRPEHFGRPRVGRYVRLEVYYTSDTPYKVYQGYVKSYKEALEFRAWAKEKHSLPNARFIMTTRYIGA